MEPIFDHSPSNKTDTSNALYYEIEEHVRNIESILLKDILSRRDVFEINRLYQEVSRLEKKCDRIPSEYNSTHVLGKITEKIQKIAKVIIIYSPSTWNVPEAKNLISLYHLKDFVDKGLSIQQHFDNLSAKIERKDRIQEEIATSLPETDSVVEFDKDIVALIGSNPSEKTKRILQQKRRRIEDYELTTQKVRDRKAELIKLREQNPQGYPSYLNELLDSRFVHLYDHLIEMKKIINRIDREKEIEKMTFSEASHVILDTTQAIIEKVSCAITGDCKNVIFLLGGSGVGKSTTLCFLRGDKMVLKGNHYESEDADSGIISHDLSSSCTFLPTVQRVKYMNDDWRIVDFPGFEDTHGSLISLGMECALKALTNRYSPRVVVLESITNTEGKFAAAGRLGLRLQRLLEDKNRCYLGITKYTCNPDFLKIKMIEEIQYKEKTLPNDEEKALVTAIETLSNLKLDNLQPIIEEKQREL